MISTQWVILFNWTGVLISIQQERWLRKAAWVKGSAQHVRAAVTNGVSEHNPLRGDLTKIIRGFYDQKNIRVLLGLVKFELPLDLCEGNLG